MIEIDDELAYYIHGLNSSNSDNDSDDMKEFDEEYNLMKPPPYDYELIKNRIIIISSQVTSEENNNEIKKIEVVSKVAMTNRKLNKAQICNKKTNIRRKKVDMFGQVSCDSRKSAETICSNQMLKTKVKSEYSKSKTKKKRTRSAAKLYDLRTIDLCEKKYLGLNIITREQFEKEFPSLEEVYQDKFRSTCKIYKTKPTSSSIWNKKKKKQFKPLKMEINYHKYNIPNEEYVLEVKNRKRLHKIRENKTQCDNTPPVTNETIHGKRKIKRQLKQSVKVLLNKNVLNKFDYIRHIAQLASGKTHTKICIPIDICKYNY